MFKNYGDVDFFENGIYVEGGKDNTFSMLLCKPYSDQENLFQFAQVKVDISDEWIDKKAVMEFIGMTEETWDPVQFAIGCTDYYSWDNFGADNYMYDWRRMRREDIEPILVSFFVSQMKPETKIVEPPKKAYQLTFEEVISHTFYVDADSEDDAIEIFEEHACEGELDFSDGNVIDSKIISVTCLDDNTTSNFCCFSYGDLERLAYAFKSYVMEDLEGTSDPEYIKMALDSAGVSERDIELLDLSEVLNV